ncbi:MAG: NADH-quinone oxidoreductase subunit G [Gammaproteobacteria bacterium]|nr:NADH-quinone oxidoreductase subunit G [Gammaproteobacteria bacterium]
MPSRRLPDVSQDKITITVNGVELEARPGQMLIEVTDAADIYVPRFCYHAKLSVAANCRLCLVEVENASKPLPACATPVAAGMKVHTRSAKAIGAQRATMEFLLINHPLDCPICDQGGECELQDLAMGFGRDISRYTERKRVVRDKNIGPLVSTDMTRCIHCTRCVRFTEEIAGFQELGTMGRSDRVEISTWIERSVEHELSGNIIDLCPVGALNSKPYRFSARAWEMSQHPTVAPHDCTGAHLYAHVMDGRIKRVVPRACESINETWASDRDRFSYEGLDAPDRLREPMVREDDGLRVASWDEALDRAAAALRDAGADSGALVSPSATVEEGFLLNRLFGHLGSANIDHRLRQRDFRGQGEEPAWPSLGLSIAAVEFLDQLLVVGSNLRHEAPLIAHRVRKAAQRGAGVHFVNPARYPYLFPVGQYYSGDVGDFWRDLASLVLAATDKVPGGALAQAVAGAPQPEDRHRQLVGRLREAKASAILLGQLTLRHPRRAEIELLAAELARLTGSSIGVVSEGANSAGLSLVGVLPHRDVGGRSRATQGLPAATMLARPPRALMLVGIEPEADCVAGDRLTRHREGTVIALTSWLGPGLKSAADVVLPIAAFGETPGTFVNCEGRWQSFDAVARPPAAVRPAWKVLRVLGNNLGVADFNYESSDAVRVAAAAAAGDPRAAAYTARSAALPAVGGGSVNLSALDVPMYEVDALLRRAGSLQQTADGRKQSQATAERRTA